MNKNLYTSGAILSGMMLAITIFINGELARFTSPVLSSMIAHGVGILGSWVVWKLITKTKQRIPYQKEAPIWSYLGGIIGATIVIITNITINSEIGLIGSFSFMILGQTVFSILMDYRGSLGFEKRKLSLRDFQQMGLILCGSLIIIAF